MSDALRRLAGIERRSGTTPSSEPGRIRIGNQTAFSAARLLEPFEYALANGFDAFEWMPDRKADGAGWDEGDLDPSLRKEIRGAARAQGMRLSVHGRALIHAGQEQHDSLLPRDLRLAQDLGAVVLVLHLTPDVAMADFARALGKALREARTRDFAVAIENTPAATPSQFRELFAALAGVRSSELPAIGMCLDIGHANLCPATRNDYLGYLDQLDPRVPINHLHLHENWGDEDTHLTLFTGPAEGQSQGVQGLLERLHRRGYAGSFILEQWPQPPSLLNRARDRLLKIWRDLEDGTPGRPCQAEPRLRERP